MLLLYLSFLARFFNSISFVAKTSETLSNASSTVSLFSNEISFISILEELANFRAKSAFSLILPLLFLFKPFSSLITKLWSS